MRAAEQWLAERGVVKAHLTVRGPDAVVVKFYESAGYGVTPNILMEKWLRKPG